MGAGPRLDQALFEVRDVHDGFQHGRRQTRAGRVGSRGSQGDRVATQGARPAGHVEKDYRAANGRPAAVTSCGGSQSWRVVSRAAPEIAVSQGTGICNLHRRSSFWTPGASIVI